MCLIKMCATLMVPLAGLFANHFDQVITNFDFKEQILCQSARYIVHFLHRKIPQVTWL